MISEKLQMHILKGIIWVYFVSLKKEFTQDQFWTGGLLTNKNVSTLSVNVSILRKIN